MLRHKSLPAVLLCCIVISPAFGAATSLNTIPTTDIVPMHSWVGQVQNGNISLQTPAFYSSPNLLLQSQFALNSRIEAGMDYVQPPALNHDELVFNIKDLLQNEDETRPNAALGVWNVGVNQAPDFYLTLSKTLNFAQEQQERFRAHHRRNRKLLGRRVHAGLLVDTNGVVEPFLGTDLQLNGSTLFQADWISGSGNAVTAGLLYALRDQRTTISPYLLLSNDKGRLGFSLLISHQFNLK